MGILKQQSKEHESEINPLRMREAGHLLPVEAIDRTGLVITSDGVLVRILHVIPPNPLALSERERERVAGAFSRLVARLRPGESVQFYVESRPVNLWEVLERSRAEVGLAAGEPPQRGRPARDAEGLSRWRLYGAMEESLRLHSDDFAAVQFNTYVVVPYLPRVRDARTMLRQVGPHRTRMPSGPLERQLQPHRRAIRESLAQVDSLRVELDGLSLESRLLNGEEVAQLLWSRFNPTYADSRRRPPRFADEILGELDVVQERAEAQRAARGLREAIARSPLDFRRSKRHVEIDEDVEQTIYTSSTADATSMGWLMGAMTTRQPFTLSVHVDALDRRRERRRLKVNHRRIFAVNRSAEAKGRVPDFDRYSQEHEAEQILAEMAGHERAGVYRVSIYQSLRARGPDPDLAALAEAVDYCADQIESSSDCRVSRGEFQQLPLWQSTLPLGRDVARRKRRYVTRNVGDTVPLIGMSCGSPQGIPFAFSDPGRTLELLDPYDRTHANNTMVVSGRSGSGKTMAANVILSRCVSHGARAFVVDRAGHYQTLTQLVAGAGHIDIGTDESAHAINPWDVPDPGEVSLEKIAFLEALHGVMMGDEGLTTLERSQLGAAIRAVYARGAETGAVPRESMLRDELLARSRTEQADGSADIAGVLRSLAERLGEFCGDGAYAYLLDRETTVSTDSPLVVFDTARCPEIVLQPVMFAIVEHVTREIARHRRQHESSGAQPSMFGGRTVLLIDEAWHLVGRAETGTYANDLARRARHLGLFFIVMSQHLSDFETEHGLALLRNSTMQLLFAQHADEVPFVQEALRLSDQEAELIARLKTVKGSHSQALWVNGSRGRGRVALRLGPTEYWAYTSDPLRDVPMRDAAIAAHDDDAWAGVVALARRVRETAEVEA
jgi:TraG P-loop domain